LTRLATAGVIEAGAAAQAGLLYERCRFGKGSIDGDEFAATLSVLEAGAARVEAMDEDSRRDLLERQLPSGSERCNPRLGRNRSRQALSARRGSEKADREAARLASRRKRRAEHGPSRLWTFIACGLVVWTLAVMAGSLWQHDRIEKMLGSSEWGRPLISRLRGERQEHSELRRQVEADKRSATAGDFSRLADQYLVRREYAEAIHAYQQGLAREAAPAQRAAMLNSLAWMLLTANDPWYRDAVQAQQLAQLAVDLRREPEHYDTLAVAHFQNNNLAKAIELETIAVELAMKWPESFGDQRYYKQQLLDFQHAARALPKAEPQVRP
jgi:tetratricopeptide (TPR) repeat protein